MNKLLEERLVQIISREDIDSLEPNSIIYAKNSPMRVFEVRACEMMTFYFHYNFEPDTIQLLTTPRYMLANTGNMISFMSGSKSISTQLTPESGDMYQKRRDDLVALGLMK